MAQPLADTSFEYYPQAPEPALAPDGQERHLALAPLPKQWGETTVFLGNAALQEIKEVYPIARYLSPSQILGVLMGVTVVFQGRTPDGKPAVGCHTTLRRDAFPLG